MPGTENPGGLQSTASQRVGHNWSDLAHVYTDPVLSENLSVWSLPKCPGSGQQWAQFCSAKPFSLVASWGFQLQQVLIIPPETPKETLCQSLFMLLNRLPHPAGLPLSSRQTCPLPCSPGQSVRTPANSSILSHLGHPDEEAGTTQSPVSTATEKKTKQILEPESPMPEPLRLVPWEPWDGKGNVFPAAWVLLHLHLWTRVPHSAQALTSSFASATRSVPRPHLNVPFSRQYQESHFFPLSLQVI